MNAKPHTEQTRLTSLEPYDVEAVLEEHVSEGHGTLPTVRLTTATGEFVAVRLCPLPESGSPGSITKVCARMVRLGEDLAVVCFEPRGDLDPLHLLSGVSWVDQERVSEIFGIVEQIRTPPLREFVRDVFSVEAVYRGFFLAPASGNHHHARSGGLAIHSAEVARSVMQSLTFHRCNLDAATDEEFDLGIVAGLLHDIGKVVGYTPEGLRTERHRRVGHEWLGWELMQGPLEKLRHVRADLADALVALLLGRTRYIESRHRVDGLRELVCKADRRSVEGWRRSHTC